jgi:hypothetical protein
VKDPQLAAALAAAGWIYAAARFGHREFFALIGELYAQVGAHGGATRG